MLNNQSFLFLSIRNDQKDFFLVMEYADSGTLKNYLRENYKNLNWNNKFNLAFQLAHVVSCLHDEEIVHRNLVFIILFYLFIYFYIMHIQYLT
jgi:serine/threonine protein kinase